MSLTGINHQIDQIEGLAKLKIAQRCQTDLFYLCKYILGYNLMTEGTHGELCRYTYPLLPNPPHSTPEDTIKLPDGRISSPIPTHTKNFIGIDTQNVGTLDVHIENEESLIKNGLYKPAISDTQSGLDVPVSIGEGKESVHDRQKDQFDPRKNQLLLLMPRGTFKSSVVTIGFSLQYMLNDPDCRILIDSETFSKGKAFLMEIKGHLEGNDKFREVFKTLFNVYPDANAKRDLWSDAAFNIAARKRKRKEPTYSCGGVDVTKNGMHYDLIIMDDLHSELNITTKEQLDKVKDHYKLAFSLLDPGQPLIVIGTRWDYNDVYQHILDFEAENFNILIRRAEYPDGRLLFPERLSKEFLEKTKRTQGSYIYSCQYLNEPVDDETATFKRSMLQTRSWELVKDVPINWYAAFDPSFEGQYSDYAAGVVAGMDFQRNLYVRHITRKKMTYADIINLMFDIYHTYQPKEMALETIAAQKSIQYMLNDEQRKRGEWLPVREIKSRTKSKEERIRGLAPYYEFGRVFHIKECPGREELEYELIHFPKGTHDDVIDALATILEIAQPGSQKSVASRERRRTYASFKPRSPLTGV